jgi:hypothetical protein
MPNKVSLIFVDIVNRSDCKAFFAERIQNEHEVGRPCQPVCFIFKTTWRISIKFGIGTVFIVCHMTGNIIFIEIKTLQLFNKVQWKVITDYTVWYLCSSFVSAVNEHKNQRVMQNRNEWVRKMCCLLRCRACFRRCFRCPLICAWIFSFSIIFITLCITFLSFVKTLKCKLISYNIRVKLRSLAWDFRWLSASFSGRMVSQVSRFNTFRGAHGRTGNLIFGGMWKGEQQKQAHGGTLCGFIVYLTFIMGH